MIFSAREITTLFDYNQLFGSFSFSKNIYAFFGKHRNVFGKIRTCFPLNEKSLREFPVIHTYPSGFSLYSDIRTNMYASAWESEREYVLLQKR